MTVRAKKHLGQHFLTDKNIARKIVESLPAEHPGKVLEIGPGMGVLTGFLLERFADRLWMIEVDAESVDYLRSNFTLPAEQILHADFLRSDWPTKQPDNFRIIGNFPYNISSQIFFKVLEHRHKVDTVVGMIQKEVAQRLASAHGSKEYGILSVLLQTFYHIEYLFSVPPQVFSPPPKVQSAVIRLQRNQRQALPCNESLFFSVVKMGFNQRRKTLRNSLKSLLVAGADHPMLNQRPEQLSADDFIHLTIWVESLTS